MATAHTPYTNSKEGTLPPKTPNVGAAQWDGRAKNHNKKRILFFAECVTLAHFGRAVALAETLDPQEYEIGFAAAPIYNHLLPSNNWNFYQIYSIKSMAFQNSLARGEVPYTAEVLQRYIKDDLAAIDGFRPDIIVGDFRLSLGVSARVRHVPYFNVMNAYWVEGYKSSLMPEILPFTKFLPLSLCKIFFSIFKPVFYATFTRRFNQLRRRYGLTPYPSNLTSVYSDGDVTLYDDAAEIIPLTSHKIAHHYLGPISWSPRMALPDWWNTLPRNHPIILVSLGSSGDPKTLKKIIGMISERGETIVVITAGHTLKDVPSHIHIIDYLPIKDVMQDCSVVITNGGIASYIPLSSGVPVLGLPRNLDQFLCTQSMSTTGAVLSLRADSLTSHALNEALDRLVNEIYFKTNAKKCADLLSQCDYRQIFPNVMKQFLNR